MTAKTPSNTKAKGRPGPKRRSWWKRILLWLSLFCLVIMALGIGFGIGGWMWISQDLPRIERLADYRPPAVTQVLAKNGELMAEFCRERRYVVPIEQIPQHVVNAFVAAEDGDFFKHPGIDIFGIIRSAIVNIRAGKVVQGGSTITQQVARGLLLTPQRTFVRKIREMILAYRIERYLTKNEILYLYLNQIYLGHGAHGVEAAAYTYFGKHVQQLDVAEAALLAGLVKAPNRYSPLRNPRRARTRQVYVINRMLANSFINQVQAQNALDEQLSIKLHRLPMVSAEYYQEAVRQWLEQTFGANLLYEGGLTVYTACDPLLTQHGAAALNTGLEQLNRRHGYKGPLSTISESQLKELTQRPEATPSLSPDQVMTAVVTKADLKTQTLTLRLGDEKGLLTLDDLKQWRSSLTQVTGLLKPGDVVLVKTVKYDSEAKAWSLALMQEPMSQAALIALEAGTNRVRVLIGGRDFKQSQYNRALQSRRQAGSAFKPFIYAAALDRSILPYTPATLLIDAPVVYDDISQPGSKWRPKNYDGTFLGPVTLRKSLEQSRNVPTVKLMDELGIPYTIEYLKNFGFSTELGSNLSLALGSTGLSLLEMVKAYSVFANQGLLIDPVIIEQVRDREGRVIYQAEPKAKQTISPALAYVMTNLLRGVMENGTGRNLRIPEKAVAGKTGTTNDQRDAWFVGYSPQLICGVWVGRDDYQPLGRRETGARAAGPVFKEFMQAALQDMPEVDFPIPEGVAFARVDPTTGQSTSFGEFEAFLAGTEPGTGVITAQPRLTEPDQTADFLLQETFTDNFSEQDPEQDAIPQ